MIIILEDVISIAISGIISREEDGLFVASASDSFSIRLWTLNNSTYVDTFVGHSHHVLAIEVYDNRTMLTSGTWLAESVCTI